MFVFEGLATFSAFELAVPRTLVENLVLWMRKYSHELFSLAQIRNHTTGKISVNNFMTGQMAPVVKQHLALVGCI